VIIMTKLSLLLTTVLVTATMGAAPVMADTDTKTPSHKMSQKVPGNVAKDMEMRKQDLAAKQGLMESLYHAQISLHNGKRVEGTKYLTEALQHLNNVVYSDTDDMPLGDTYEDHPYKGRKVIEIEFGAGLMPQHAVIPVPSKELTVDAIADSLNLDGIERGGVKDATVRYIAYDMDKEDIREGLLDAQKDLLNDDVESSQSELADVQQELLEDNEETVPARERVRDHISLTRFFMKQAEYDAAGEVLQDAESALSDMLKGTDDIETGQKLSVEMKALEKEISKRNPSLLQEIDKKLETWWNDLM